jgi:fibronectin-binding autotransporter adhesin
LKKRGAGSLTLTNFNSYIGPTVVEAGTLALSGSISGSSTIAVQGGATFDVTPVLGGFSLGSPGVLQTLKGSGIVLGNLAMTADSKLSPGDAAGTLTIAGNLDLTGAVSGSATAALIFELGALAASDKVAFTTGALTIGTGVLAFNDFAFTAQAGFGPGTYTLFDGNLPISGTLDAANRSGSVGGFTGTLSLADNGNDVVFTVVPEPASTTLLVASLGSLVGLRRFRRGLQRRG